MLNFTVTCLLAHIFFRRFTFSTCLGSIGKAPESGYRRVMVLVVAYVEWFPDPQGPGFYISHDTRFKSSHLKL